ncbi:MAG: PAS domain-containing protein [Hyphomonadaceae bacterium]
MADRAAVSSAEFIRNIGFWQNEALRRPISITHHGRERLVLAAPEVFEGVGVSAAGPEPSAATLRASADQVALLENLDDGFVGFDEELNIYATNAITETLFARASAQLHGVHVADAMPQPFASILADRLRRVLRSRKPEAFEASASEGRTLSVRVFPLGEGVAALLRNTTEQHQLRGRLEDAEGLAAALATHQRAAAIKLDSRARIKGADETFCTWCGFQEVEIVGHRFVDLMAPPERRIATDLFEGALRHAKAGQMPVSLVGKRGEEVLGTLSVAPIHTDFIAHGVSAVMVRACDGAHRQEAA